MISLLMAAAVSTADAKPDYGWTQVHLSRATQSFKVTGRVTPLDGALTIESARVAGRVLSILSREGDLVRAGTALFAISSAECTSLAEEKRIAEKKQIPELVEGVEKRSRQLGLEIGSEGCNIVATHSGSITKRNIESGGNFQLGDSLVTILDTKHLSVELDVAERDISRVKSGETVRFHLAAEPAISYVTRVKAIVPAIDPLSRTVRVRLYPTALSSYASLDGLVFGEIENGSSELVFSVPSQSLVFDKNSRFVVKEPETAVEVEVLGESGGNTYVRPKRADALKEVDRVATSQAIFLFRKIGQP